MKTLRINNHPVSNLQQSKTNRYISFSSSKKENKDTFTKQPTHTASKEKSTISSFFGSFFSKEKRFIKKLTKMDRKKETIPTETAQKIYENIKNKELENDFLELAALKKNEDEFSVSAHNLVKLSKYCKTTDSSCSLWPFGQTVTDESCMDSLALTKHSSAKVRASLVSKNIVKNIVYYLSKDLTSDMKMYSENTLIPFLETSENIEEAAFILELVKENGRYDQRFNAQDAKTALNVARENPQRKNAIKYLTRFSKMCYGEISTKDICKVARLFDSKDINFKEREERFKEIDCDISTNLDIDDLAKLVLMSGEDFKKANKALSIEKFCEYKKASDSIKNYSISEMIKFALVHYNDEKISEDKLRLKGLSGKLKKLNLSSKQINNILIAYPHTSPFIGSLPKEWLVGVEDKKGASVKVFGILDEFSKEISPKRFYTGEVSLKERKELEDGLKATLQKDIAFEYESFGGYGVIWKLSVDGKPFAVKFFFDDGKGMKNHGKNYETKNAIYLNQKTQRRQYPDFYFGKLVKKHERGGYIVCEFIDKNKEQEYRQPTHSHVLNSDASGDNVINGIIVDFGGVHYNPALKDSKILKFLRILEQMKMIEDKTHFEDFVKKNANDEKFKKALEIFQGNN